MTLPHHVGVYGGGRMGAGIAHAFLVSGARVTIIESTSDTAAVARGRVSTSVARAESLGLVDASVVLPHLEVATSSDALSGCDLVVEAVPEDPDLKSRVLASVEAAAPRAWVATNTSSLSVDGLAASLQQPDRFVGLHFFNPVPASDLVEIVVGAKTSDELARLARDWVADLGKTAITFTDSPGFASSRLGVAIALEPCECLKRASRPPRTSTPR